ncbi:hypothetical protein B0H11DRAFT_2240529 [Mycena galericulata]|nr:hypothetical protein B0H11DRAFT_2240529 [Mycena galericulata]
MSAQAIPTTIENPITLNLSGSYGVLIIAAYISCALWGINAMQGYIYYWNYPDDSWPMKMLVAFLLLVDTAHKILVTKVPWFTLVQNWGRVSAILASPQEALHEAWVGSIIVIIVQLYYLRRIAKFASTTRHARSWWLWLVIFVLVLLSVAQVPLTIAYCVFSINRANIFIPLNLRIKTAGLIAAAVVDFVIAVAMVMLLKDTDSGDGTAFKSKRTSKTIRRLTVIIVNTGMVTAIFAIDETASGTDFWTAITQYPQCSIYLSAFLANLNARRYIRGEDDGLVISNIEDLKFATATETAAGNDAEASLHIVLGQMGSGAESNGTDGQDTANDHGSTNHEKYPHRSPV